VGRVLAIETHPMQGVTSTPFCRTLKHLLKVCLRHRDRFTSFN
jgi:hypothetical protein